MATRSSILACRIPWTEEPGGLQSTGHRVNTTERLNARAAHVQSTVSVGMASGSPPSPLKLHTSGFAPHHLTFSESLGS